jgi:Winged helix DNA-binding domain
VDLDTVIARRLATQRLTEAPFTTVEDAVRALVCVQSQDAPLARWSLSMRTGQSADSDVRAAIDSGRVVRTHVLRPTWHYLLAEDLRWLLALTGEKVRRSMAPVHRRLDIADPATAAREIDGVLALIAEHGPLTRREIQTTLGRDDLRGERLGHLLMRAEVDASICSGPLRDGQHSYVLVDDVVPPAPIPDRHESVCALALRFFVGHGPASVSHLMRWAGLTKREVIAAVGDLGDALTRTQLDGETLYADPAAASDRATGGARLLPVFDEAHLTYPGGLPRTADHPWGEKAHSFSQSGGGLVLSDLRDVGWWTRSESGRTTTVTVGLSPSLGSRQRREVEDQAAALAAFTGRRLEPILA